MSEKNNDVSRREALKTLGVGVVATLPVLGAVAQAQDHSMNDHMNHGAQKTAAAQKPAALKFFTAAENQTLIEMSERIIPADDHSPGAKAARVSEYIDMVASIASEPTRKEWREGLAAINKMSRDMFTKDFAEATEAQQIKLLTEISKNEKAPKTVEEKFFKLMKNATLDGYYTSEIGIHQELKYRGNTYLKEFTGCTHPEHQQG
ncbi:MAG: gluconate 2-dehydrogenase subunit 3 family protein [Acidobacteria bacterium]|nr:gluconate 2-dehydrogenase subunit 3 family protein [Acidobacteriota bacterium]